ncbi:MAG: YdeI/OmpD-associated family protein [Flavobacteriia bacterium]|nr:YdeI/OmpD-associated family protein [Flavobacteriia bacterium]
MIQYQSQIYRLEKLKLFYVEVPMDIIQQLNTILKSNKINHRVIISINDTISWQGGIVALGEGLGYITVSTARMKKLNLHLDDSVSINLKLDNSKYGFDMPEELEELLQQDCEGKRRFELLKPSIQRYIIYYIIQVKSTEKRLTRAIQLINNLKLTHEGKEDFKTILGK